MLACWVYWNIFHFILSSLNGVSPGFGLSFLANISQDFLVKKSYPIPADSRSMCTHKISYMKLIHLVKWKEIFIFNAYFLLQIHSLLIFNDITRKPTVELWRIKLLSILQIQSECLIFSFYENFGVIFSFISTVKEHKPWKLSNVSKCLFGVKLQNDWKLICFFAVIRLTRTCR